MNILIVDDDTLIRNWLSMLLKQLKNYEIQIFEASDGIEALEICARSLIDLVITDIKMPRLNGIDLINRLNAEYPHIRTSVLSSYDDFDYVRIALKCGALDYILKAEMKIEDISALLEKVSNDFKLENSMQRGSQRNYSVISDMKQNFLKYLNDKTIPDEQFLSSITPQLTLNHLCIAIFKMGISNGGDIPVYTISSICKDAMKGENINGTAFPWNKGYFTLMYNCTDTISENQKEEYLKLFLLLDKNLEKYTGIPISHSINLVCKKDDDLRLKFAEAIDIMDYRYYYSLSASSFSKPEGEQRSPRKELISSIQKLLDAGEHEKAVAKVSEFLSHAHSSYLSPEKVKTSIVSAMNIFLTDITLRDLQNGSSEDLEILLSEAANASTSESVQNALDLFCRTYLEQIHAAVNGVSPAIKLAIEYINQHYSQKIILDDVATQVFLNRSYLSQLFKKEMDVSFGDYLEKIRINNAKRLIRDSTKSMSEVAESVGFSNQNYFTKVFKKVTGVSPLKYKRHE